MKINHQSLPTRCSICHQSDQFDAKRDTCQRCDDMRDKDWWIVEEGNGLQRIEMSDRLRKALTTGVDYLPPNRNIPAHEFTQISDKPNWKLRGPKLKETKDFRVSSESLFIWTIAMIGHVFINFGIMPSLFSSKYGSIVGFIAGATFSTYYCFKDVLNVKTFHNGYIKQEQLSIVDTGQSVQDQLTLCTPDTHIWSYQKSYSSAVHLGKSDERSCQVCHTVQRYITRVSNDQSRFIQEWVKKQ